MQALKDVQSKKITRANNAQSSRRVEPDILSHTLASITAALPERAVEEGCRRGRDEESSRRGSAGRRGGERGGCNDGNRREQRECISHPPLCALLSSISLSRYIRLNCIYAEECSRMIYVREFNTVARTVRCCYRISRLPQRMTIICGKRRRTFFLYFLFFSYFPLNQVPR